MLKVAPWTCSLDELACKGDAKRLKRVLAGGASANKHSSTAGKNKRTPLHAASYFGNVETVEVLISFGASVDARDEHGQTPLHYAAQNGHAHVADRLLIHRADHTLRDRVTKEEFYNHAFLHLVSSPWYFVSSLCSCQCFISFGFKTVQWYLLNFSICILLWDHVEQLGNLPIHVAINTSRFAIQDCLKRHARGCCLDFQYFEGGTWHPYEVSAGKALGVQLGEGVPYAAMTANNGATYIVDFTQQIQINVHSYFSKSICWRVSSQHQFNFPDKPFQGLHPGSQSSNYLLPYEPLLRDLRSKGIISPSSPLSPRSSSPVPVPERSEATRAPPDIPSQAIHYQSPPFSQQSQDLNTSQQYKQSPSAPPAESQPSESPLQPTAQSRPLHPSSSLPALSQIPAFPFVRHLSESDVHNMPTSSTSPQSHYFVEEPDDTPTPSPHEPPLTRPPKWSANRRGNSMQIPGWVNFSDSPEPTPDPLSSTAGGTSCPSCHQATSTSSWYPSTSSFPSAPSTTKESAEPSSHLPYAANVGEASFSASTSAAGSTKPDAATSPNDILRERTPPLSTQTIEGQNESTVGLAALPSSFKLLRSGTTEHSKVMEMFLQGMVKMAGSAHARLGPRPITVTCIYRAVPPESRVASFESAKAALRAAGRQPRDCIGWHGASLTNIKSIVDKGFIVSDHPKNGHLYGVGVYLAPEERAFTSAEFAPPDFNGEKHVLLCRVLLGNPEIIPFESTQSSPSSHWFNTGVDNLVKPTRYIIWKDIANKHIVPTHIVSFRYC